MKSLKIYINRNKKKPFSEWISSIKDSIAIAHVTSRIRRLSLEQYGDCKRVGNNIFELRIHYGPGYRVYFAQHGKEIIVLLFGGKKSSQKRDIKLASSYWQDYMEQYREQS